MKKKLSDAYWAFLCIWYLAGTALHLAVIKYALEQRDAAVLVLLAAWWVITLIGRKIRHSAEARRKRKKEEQIETYKNAYVREITVEDELFGKIVFEYDSKTDTLLTDAYPLEKPFGRHNLELGAHISGSDPSEAAAALRFVYSNCSGILEQIYDYTLECCEIYEECDQNGQPYGMEYIRENTDIIIMSLFDFKDSIFVNLSGCICGDNGDDLLGCHSITATMRFDPSADNSILPEISMGLEG